jgi:integrase
MTVGQMYRIMLADDYYHPSESVTQLINSLYEDIEHIVLVNYDRAALLAWIDAMKAIKNAPATIRKKVGALRTIFTYAVTCEHPQINHNVFDSLPKDYSLYKNHKNRHDTTVKRDQIRDRRLNEGEQPRIIKAIDQYPLDPRRAALGNTFHPALHLMLHMAIDTAMRLQELFLIQWQHIDVERRIINIPAAITKANKQRQVPISKALLPRLLQYKAVYHEVVEDTASGDTASGDTAIGEQNLYVLPFYVFYEANRTKCSVALSRTWKRIFKQAGLEDFHFHDLRHEGISRMVELTQLTLTQLQKISGHADSRTFDRYNNLRTENITGNFY